MSCSLRVDDILLQVRTKLQKDNIKLWQVPYYDELTGTPFDEDMQALAIEIAADLNIASTSCMSALSELQSAALEKLKQRNRFRDSGLATIKVKFLGSTPRQVELETTLTIAGGELHTIIAAYNVHKEGQFKLIANGRVIKDNGTIAEQGVTNGAMVLVLNVIGSATDIHASENQYRELEMTKDDTVLLASDVDSQYLQLEDQQGNTIRIPASERKSLMVAMALHEKGRSALKKDDYGKALVFLLDADKEFRRCNSALLSSVDNYALLDLDIAWRYLCLQSFQHLPEAQERLNRCEAMFHKSYGQNLERLIALKGTSGNERALFMRLHLLQGIVLYHQNKRADALNMMQKAQSELVPLKVDTASMAMLVELGYSSAESRLGLRTTHGDVNLAANYINESRQKRFDARKKALADELLDRERKKLGMCIDGKQYVDPNFVKMLVNMGYSKSAATVALKHCNNVLSDSIQYIQEHPFAGPSHSRSQEFRGLIEELLPDLMSAGFDYHYAKLALLKHEGDVMKAAEDLLANGGVIEGELPDNDSERDSILRAEKEAKRIEQEKKQKEDALMRLSQDIAMVDDDYLDLTLEKEEEFLMQYMSLF